MATNWLEQFKACGYSVLTAGTEPGPWHAASHDRTWVIMNERTGKTKKIGPVSMGRGKNYFSDAEHEARRRNASEFNTARAEGKLPTMLGLSEEMDAAIDHALRHPEVPDILGTIREAKDLACQITSAAAQDPLEQLARHLVSCHKHKSEDIEKVLQFSGYTIDRDVVARVVKHMQALRG